MFGAANAAAVPAADADDHAAADACPASLAAGAATCSSGTSTAVSRAGRSCQDMCFLGLQHRYRKCSVCSCPMHVILQQCCLDCPCLSVLFCIALCLCRIVDWHGHSCPTRVAFIAVYVTALLLWTSVLTGSAVQDSSHTSSAQSPARGRGTQAHRSRGCPCSCSTYDRETQGE